MSTTGCSPPPQRFLTGAADEGNGIFGKSVLLRSGVKLSCAAVSGDWFDHLRRGYVQKLAGGV